MNTPHLNDLRSHLMETLASLRDRTSPMEPDRARAVAQVASVLVDTAKVEIDYLKVTGADSSNFLESPATQPRLHADTPSAHNPFPNVIRHRLQG